MTRCLSVAQAFKSKLFAIRHLIKSHAVNQSGFLTGETGCGIKEGLSFGALVSALKTSPMLNS